MLQELVDRLDLSVDECKGKYGDILYVKKDEDILEVCMDVVNNDLLKMYTYIKKDKLHLNLEKQNLIDCFYDTLLIYSPVCWFELKIDSLLQTMDITDLPKLLWRLIQHEEVENLKYTIPGVMYGDIAYLSNATTDKPRQKLDILKCKNKHEGKAFLAILMRYPIFLSLLVEQGLLFELLLLPDLYPCTEAISSIYKGKYIQDLRNFHENCIPYEVMLTINKEDCLFLPINHPFYSVTKASKEDIRYLLKFIVGKWLLDLDMSKTSLTGSLICCALRHLIHYEGYEGICMCPSYQITGLPWFNKYTYRNGTVTIRDKTYPILPGVDVDLAIDVNTYDELKEEAIRHYKIVRKYYPNAVLQEVVTKGEENDHIKYKITTTNNGDYYNKFRDIDMYKADKTHCQYHNISPVRAYWDGDMIYATQSCVVSHIEKRIYFYIIHKGVTHMKEVLQKYQSRGFRQDIINLDNVVAYDDVLNRYKINDKIVEISRKAIYSNWSEPRDEHEKIIEEVRIEEEKEDIFTPIVEVRRIEVI